MTINKHVEDIKKVTRAGERIFSDLATLKALQDSSITVTNKNGHVIVGKYTGYKELEFYSTKSDFVEPMCKKFCKSNNNEKLVMYIKHKFTLENYVLIKVINDS